MIALLVAALIAAAGSSHSVTLKGVPLFAICAGLAFLIQWIAFIPAWVYKTEMYYDLTGSATYIIIVVASLALNESTKARDVLIGLMIVVWAARLGSFSLRAFERTASTGASVKSRKTSPHF
ncbi:MAG: DUF1295 domain-containing protein [Gammaproteobacteria bacterium]|nr:DUF1295 domain-containing protein [Gammaproteobacteria bacterium]